MNSLFSRSPNKGEELRLNSLEDADKIVWFLDQLLFTYSLERLEVSNREDENQEEEEVEDAAFTSDESNDGSETEDEAGLSESEELVFNASDETYPKGLNLTRTSPVERRTKLYLHLPSESIEIAKKHIRFPSQENEV
ncbi:hypothetical protein P9112_001113 [Eukaryota sp. TZLM1-RC]